MMLSSNDTLSLNLFHRRTFVIREHLQLGVTRVVANSKTPNHLTPDTVSRHAASHAFLL